MDLSAPVWYAARYHPGGVFASICIAVLASYVTLDLARRVHRSDDGALRWIWWGVGALVMGSGIWAMHFVGMLSVWLPFELGFTGGLTLLSWITAVAASGIALGIASRQAFQARLVVIGSLAMGAAISGMHYLGMAALDVVPGIVWDPTTVALSVLVAVGASAAALAMFQLLLQIVSARRVVFQLVAALLMGAAISGMHYTGMAAARFAEGTVCLSVDALGGSGLTTMVVLATAMLLIGTLFASILDARMQGRTRRLTRSLQQANEELRLRAFADALTGLPNRLLLEDRLEHALQRLDRIGDVRRAERIALLFIDLDGFKPINDSFGHAAGDLILQTAADRLRGLARTSDTVARIGGDEFLLLLEGVPDAAGSAIVAQRVIDILSQPFDLWGREVQIACSVGVVVYPDQGDRQRLVADADAAMYAAKRAGGGTYALFEAHMGSDASDQLELQSDLRRAIDQNQFELYYQPKIDGASGRISGVEALLRWNHPQRGLVSPIVFIGLAERFGLIVRLGNWVIEEAGRQIAAWSAQGLDLSVAVNVSVQQLRGHGLAERIAEMLARHGVQASQLLCEITESVAMEDIRTTQTTMAELERIGVFLAIDDFGTGYSSLSYLRQLPAQQLKIDRSFVLDLEKSEDARAVVAAVIRLAHALGLRVVAEGVETVCQRDILLGLGCDELQGYFYARPMQAPALLAWWQNQASKTVALPAPQPA
ncbi:EAL domain-containing protein [uncultured Xylophilus sp.]|uniref:putative bifunctional diguanylate cyclase/phosphodiesterase n=1 Tax=uncultured Xylophilus sp. TaxID=296832 RepID=UPI0025DAA51B|nr:EAL domain-containing protein [uncultured Xylophilus sp.]